MLALNPRSGDYSGASLEMRFIAFLHLLIVFYHRRLLFSLFIACNFWLQNYCFFFDICKEISEKAFRKRGGCVKNGRYSMLVCMFFDA